MASDFALAAPSIPTRIKPVGYDEDATPAVPYDAKVGWLESTGTQYIDTGVPMGPGISIVADIVPKSLIDKVFGAYHQASDTELSLSFPRNPSAVIWFMAKGASSEYASVSLDYALLDQSLRVLASQTSLSVNGIVGTVPAWTPPDVSALNLFIFGRNEMLSGGQSISYGHCRVIRFAIFSDGFLVRDFIPVRVGTLGFLYDKANPTGGPLGDGLYPNSGTGAFVVGPDKI